MKDEIETKSRVLVRALVAMSVGLLLWLPVVHVFFAPQMQAYVHPTKMAPQVEKMLHYQLRHWRDPASRQKVLARLRGSNAEWDFMGRSFLVWALANLSLRQPTKKAQYLAIMDAIIDDTIRLEKAKGMMFFLMPYAKHKPFVMQPPRSQFLDGEIALMMGVRRMIQEHKRYKQLMLARVKVMVARMPKSPTLSLESYPNEAWTFCNTTSLAAIKLSDVLDQTNHEGLFRAWIKRAKEKLIHKPSGLLISAFTLDGKVLQGPEGSSIWMSIHNLMLIDPAFARAQYKLAKSALVRQVMGFAYAKEWPASWKASADIDSGPIVPFLGASAGSSGLAFVAAGALSDHKLLGQLLASLQLAAFPLQTKESLRFLASNQVGDAVMLYSLVQGPLWKKIQRHQSPPNKQKPAKGSEI